MTTTSNKPMNQTIYLDWVVATCPCGESCTGEGKVITNFHKKHKACTNGTVLEIYNGECLRILSKLPKDTLYCIECYTILNKCKCEKG
jgi:hypothetical protein